MIKDLKSHIQEFGRALNRVSYAWGSGSERSLPVYNVENCDDAKLHDRIIFLHRAQPHKKNRNLSLSQPWEFVRGNAEELD